MAAGQTRLEGAKFRSNDECRQLKTRGWLARCRWLKSTRLDGKTRHRLDRLIAELEREDQRNSENRYKGRFG
jgi:hypothetical protein